MDPPFNPIGPANYIPFLGTNVSVNGLNRGVSDTGGMIISLTHIQLAGPFAMTSMIGYESMNFAIAESGVLGKSLGKSHVMPMTSSLKKKLQLP